MRAFISLVTAAILVAVVGCSSSGNATPCCMASFDSGSSSGTFCGCGSSGTITVQSTATGCTISGWPTPQSATVSGTPLAVCPDAF